jgi:hypothetical protein
MPFGLEYGGTFGYFTFSQGLFWLVFSFIYLFCFSYFALRGKAIAWKWSVYVALLSLIVNVLLVYFQVSAFTSTVLGIGAYLVISFFVTQMQIKQVLKVVCIITVNFIVAGFVPDYFRWAYDIFLLYTFYVISENRLKKETAIIQK